MEYLELDSPSLDNICAEVYSILCSLGKDYMSVIEPSIVDSIMALCNKKDEPNIGQNKELNEQCLSEEANAIIERINLHYWCRSNSEKEKLINTIQNNKKSHDKVISLLTGSNLKKHENILMSLFKYDSIKIFQDGLAVVGQRDVGDKYLYGCIDKNGEEIIPCKYNLFYN